jgi:hypothetical protein
VQTAHRPHTNCTNTTATSHAANMGLDRGAVSALLLSVRISCSFRPDMEPDCLSIVTAAMMSDGQQCGGVSNAICEVLLLQQLPQHAGRPCSCEALDPVSEHRTCKKASKSASHVLKRRAR